MMPADGPEAVVAVAMALAAGCLALGAWWYLRDTTRGASGRPEDELVADLYRETERRAGLIVALASSREARIARQERR